MIGPIAKSTFSTSLVLGMRLLVQASTLLIVARLLGPQQFGSFAGVAALALVFGSLSAFGTHVVVLRDVSIDPKYRYIVFRYAVPTVFVFGGALFFAYLLISVNLFLENGITLPVLLLIGVSEILIQPLFSLPAAEHLALGRTARSQMLGSLPPVLRCGVVIIIMLVQPHDVLSMYSYGYLFAALLALLIASALMPAPWPHPRTWRLPRKAEIRAASGYAVLSGTAAGPSELDKTLAAKLLPSEPAGLYAVATRIISAATLPIVAMMLSSLPRLFRGDHGQRKATNNLLRWIFISALFYSLGLSLCLWFSAPVFPWLLGSQFNDIEFMITWLIVSVPGLALRTAAGSALMALGKPWIRAGFEFAGLFVLVITSVILIHQYGVVGMPLALAFSEWIMVFLGWGLILRDRGIRKSTSSG